MKFSNVIKLIAKNLLAFLIGSIIGALSTLIIVPIAMQSAMQNKTGVEAVVAPIALIPVFFIIYGILGIIIGGILGIIIYNLIKYFRNRKKNK